jgi:uncharacterized protein YecT (DUF1311 family)
LTGSDLQTTVEARHKMRLSIVCCLPIVTVSTAFGQHKKETDPCARAQSQAEMNICIGKRYEAADGVLNQIYKQLSSMLDDEEQAQLRETETAWLKYRDANCEFVADEYKGGSIRTTIQALCLAEMTRNRTTELKNQIKERRN